LRRTAGTVHRRVGGLRGAGRALPGTDARRGPFEWKYTVLEPDRIPGVDRFIEECKAWVQAAPRSIVALGKLENASSQYVDIEATVKTLWKPSSPKIQQVGLLEDETGTTKFTSWMKSGAKLAEQYPLRRLGRPEDVADAMLFLASDEADWITGQALVADDGFSCG
jgi:hypothetical protein